MKCVVRFNAFYLAYLCSCCSCDYLDLCHCIFCRILKSLVACSSTITYAECNLDICLRQFVAEALKDFTK